MADHRELDTTERHTLIFPIRVEFQDLISQVQLERARPFFNGPSVEGNPPQNAHPGPPKPAETESVRSSAPARPNQTGPAQSGPSQQSQPENSHPGPPQRDILGAVRMGPLPSLDDVGRTHLGPPDSGVRTAEIRGRSQIYIPEEERVASSAPTVGVRARSEDGNSSLVRDSKTQIGPVELRFTVSGQTQVRTSWLGSGIILSPMDANSGTPPKMIPPSTDWTTVDIDKYKVEYGNATANGDGKGFSLEHPKALNLQKMFVPTVQLHDSINGKHLPLPPGIDRSIVVGRKEARGQITFPEDMVSAKHVQLTQKADGLYVKDLGSTHGTYIKELSGLTKRVSENGEVKVNAGDRIYFGKPMLEFPFLTVTPINKKANPILGDKFLLIPPISQLSGTMSDDERRNSSDGWKNRTVTNGEVEGTVVTTANNGKTLIVQLADPPSTDSNKLKSKLEKALGPGGFVDMKEGDLDPNNSRKPNSGKFESCDLKGPEQGFMPNLYLTKDGKVVEIKVNESTNKLQIREQPNFRAIDKNDAAGSLKDESVYKNLGSLKKQFESLKNEPLSDAELSTLINRRIQAFHRAQGTDSDAVRKTVFEFRNELPEHRMERFFFTSNGEERPVEYKDGKYFELHDPATSIDPKVVSRKIILHRDLFTSNPGQAVLLTYMEADASNLQTTNRIQQTRDASEPQNQRRASEVSSGAALYLGPEVMSTNDYRQFESSLMEHNQQLISDLSGIENKRELSPELRSVIKKMKQELKSNPRGMTIPISDYLLTKEGQLIGEHLKHFKPLSIEEVQNIQSSMLEYSRELYSARNALRDDTSESGRQKAARLDRQAKLLADHAQAWFNAPAKVKADMTRAYRTAGPEHAGKRYLEYSLSKSKYLGLIPIFLEGRSWFE
ncbi:MAG: FHA domain-containing protein [Candidatus Obscuribacterales bacterium]|nr:FHA domain-containing protein [Candidatus Obscuribacterales bacterium]